MRCPILSLASLLAVLVSIAVAAPVDPGADRPPSVAFDRDVKPVLARHCLSCHGAEKQKSGLRLDRKSDGLKGGDSGAAIVPGNSAKSLLYQLVSGQDKDRPMPPKGRLSAPEIAMLKTWIDQGAIWPDDGSGAAIPTDWWSLKPLMQPKVPDGAANPIDAFILAKLKEKGLTRSPPADRRTLARRLYFDLTGLPPTPEALDAFAANDAADAYEKLVDELLASPRYGERWARHWLDVVHFGETHGYDKDQPRPNAWPYRDYVIRSFNADKPYDRFVREQVAGDVFYPDTVDGIEGLGFLAAGPWDFIGHVEVPESKIDGKVARHLDRDDFVSNTIGTFMGLTVHCAQCHNHKFDPITQEDYYRLQADFAAIDRTDKAYDADPQTAARRAELEVRKKTATEKLAGLQAVARRKAGPELAALEKQIAEATRPAKLPRPAEYGYHSAISPRQDAVKWVQIDLGAVMKIDRLVLRPCHDEFNSIGAGFGFPVRFKVEVSTDAAFKKDVTVVVDHTSEDFANPGTAPATAEAKGAAGRYVRVTATKLALRQNDYILALAELEAYDSDGNNRAMKAAVTALDSIEAPVRWRKANLTDGLYPPAPKLSAEELTKLSRRREELLKSALGEAGIVELAIIEADLKTIGVELGKLSAARRVAYVGAIHVGGGAFSGTGPFGGKPRSIHILPRGDVTRPGKEVGPGAIAAIPELEADFHLTANHSEGDRRAALAKWLTDPKNPLTWRVMANRVWQYHFGRGIVDTPNDFGRMGQLPTHSELLDHLAADLRTHQSIKRLHKLIVMSATYKQSSSFSLPQGEGLGAHDPRAAIDGDNRFLWRQNRRKLEAEAVRDSILAVSGKLDLTMGGPSFQDFVVEKPEHSPHYEYQLFDPENPRTHRRAVYRFIVRSRPQPFMAALDCADPSLAVDKRNETLSPQQALALLNNKLAVAMARHFAERVEKMAPDLAGRVTAAVRLALGRDPTPRERDALTAYAKEHGLANACRVILNLNEFMFAD